MTDLPGRPSCFSDQLENTNLVEDFEILLPDKFCWILLSSFKGEVENISVNETPGRPSCFSDRPEKHYLVEYIEHLVPVKVCYILFSSFRGEVVNFSANQSPGLLSSDLPEKHNFYLSRGHWDLCFLSSFVEFRSTVSEEKTNISQLIRARGVHFVFPICPKNTNFVEDIEILLPIKFHLILFSGCRGEVENVSANQSPGRSSRCSDRPEKHKLGKGRWDLVNIPVKFRWTLLCCFRGEVENMKS